MRVRVKICGVTTSEAVNAAVECGADAVGFVFSPSPRQVTIAEALALSRGLSPFVARVAVFARASMDDVRPVLELLGPDAVEADEVSVRLLGPSVSSRTLPVFHDAPGVVDRIRRLVGDASAPPAVVLDGAASGAGVRADWGRASRAARLTRLVLAGGLTPDNVGEAIRTVRPFAVDVSSGVESSPGRKDPVRIARFLAAVRRAEVDA